MNHRPNSPPFKFLLTVLVATLSGCASFADAIFVGDKRSILAEVISSGGGDSQTKTASPIYADFNDTAKASVQAGGETSETRDDAGATATASQTSSLGGSLLRYQSTASAGAGAEDLAYSGFTVVSEFDVLFTLSSSHAYQLSGSGVFNGDDLAQSMSIVLSRVETGGVEIPIHRAYEEWNLSVAESGLLTAGTYRLLGGFSFGGPHPTGGSMDLGFSLQLTDRSIPAVPENTASALMLALGVLVVAGFNRTTPSRTDSSALGIL
jgi:hypothetical protein